MLVVFGTFTISTLEDPIEFYEISDVLTTGYSEVETQIQPYIVGEKTYTVGPWRINNLC